MIFLLILYIDESTYAVHSWSVDVMISNTSIVAASWAFCAISYIEMDKNINR